MKSRSTNHAQFFSGCPNGVGQFPLPEDRPACWQLYDGQMHEYQQEQNIKTESEAKHRCPVRK